LTLACGASKKNTDSATNYGTRPDAALCCPDDPQNRVTDERHMVSFANDDVVIPPIGSKDPAKIKDVDATEEMHSDAEKMDYVAKEEG